MRLYAIYLAFNSVIIVFLPLYLVWMRLIWAAAAIERFHSQTEHRACVTVRTIENVHVMSIVAV